MDTVVQFVIVVTLFSVVVILFSYLFSEKCVICGRRHWNKRKVYHCEQCGKAFCNQDIGLSERNTLSQGGWFTNIDASSRVVRTTEKSCGVVHNQITQGVTTVHVYCRNHIP